MGNDKIPDMKTLAMRIATEQLSIETIWQRVSEIETYPKRIKYCQRVFDIDIREGGHYTDVTTLLWVPITIRHTIESIKQLTEIKYFLTLPGGGVSQQMYHFSHEHGKAVLVAKVTFDLGHPILTETIGVILKYRLVRMLRSAFPEIKAELLK